MPEDAHSDPTRFARFMDELIAFSTRTLGQRIMLPDDDHRGFMIWNYCTKMTYHARSVICLISNGLGRDAGIVARTMMEGVGYLNWAMKDDMRSELWRAFFWVEAYRFWQHQTAQGRHPADKHRVNLKTMLERYGKSFLKNRRAVMPEIFSTGSECAFRWDWLPPDQREEWKRETSALGLDAYFYSAFSRWIHWNCEAIAATIDESEKGWVVSHDDPTHSNAALLIGCGSLFPVLRLLNDHFKLGLEEELQCIERMCFLDPPRDGSTDQGIHPR